MRIIATPTQLKKIQADVYRRDFGICQLCQFPVNPNGAWKGPSYHHIIPRSRVRIDHIDNFVLLHWDCHDIMHRCCRPMSVDDLIEAKREQLGEFYDYRKIAGV